MPYVYQIGDLTLAVIAAAILGVQLGAWWGRTDIEDRLNKLFGGTPLQLWAKLRAKPKDLISLASVIQLLQQHNEDDRKLIDRWDHDAGRRYWLRRDIIAMLEKVETL